MVKGVRASTRVLALAGSDASDSKLWVGICRGLTAASVSTRKVASLFTVSAVICSWLRSASSPNSISTVRLARLMVGSPFMSSTSMRLM